MPSTQRFQQRDAVSGPTLSPPWLIAHASNGERYMYTIGLGLDALLEKLNQAELAKCPGHGGPTALPFQAADRLLIQGVGETDDQFSARLRDAFAAWAIAGSNHAILSQMQAYLTNTRPGVDPGFPECLIVSGDANTTTWDTVYGYMAQGAAPAHLNVSPPNWDWDGKYKSWRSWLVLFMQLAPVVGLNGTAATVASTGGSGVPGVTSGFATITGLSGMTSDQIQQYLILSNTSFTENSGTFQIVDVLSSSSVIVANPSAIAPDPNDGSLFWSVGYYPYIGPAPVWGSPQFTWGQNWTWGVNASQFVVESIRSIVKRWKSASTYFPFIMFSFAGDDGTSGKEFSPLSSPGAGNPNGTWGEPAVWVDGQTVPSRVAAAGPFSTALAVCHGTGIAVNCYIDTLT